jgi:CRISPR/Cas system type I-B associated protein Csh2 (Cas7 group RAMP superfamily)
MTKLTLVNLTGTEKQIAWANDIRNNMLNEYYYNKYSEKTLDEMFAVRTDEKLLKYYAKTDSKFDVEKMQSVLDTLTKSEYWINNKSNIVADFKNKIYFYDSYMEQMNAKTMAE